MKLNDFLPTEAQIEAREFCDKFGGMKVVEKFDGTIHAFPDLHYRYRNVYSWVLLDDGSVVGWNESPRTGWSYPRIGKKAAEKFYFRSTEIKPF